jgi:chloramphenicol O-acetyltransferase type A
VNEDIFSFCTVNYYEDFSTFAELAKRQVDKVKNDLQLDDEQGRDDWLFMTSIPWFSFTAIRHPMESHPRDSIPRFAWGKFFAQGDSLLMPLSVDAHHGLVDGIHVGKYYTEIEKYFGNPAEVLGSR